MMLSRRITTNALVSNCGNAMPEGGVFSKSIWFMFQNRMYRNMDCTITDATIATTKDVHFDITCKLCVLPLMYTSNFFFDARSIALWHMHRTSVSPVRARHQRRGGGGVAVLKIRGLAGWWRVGSAERREYFFLGIQLSNITSRKSEESRK